MKRNVVAFSRRYEKALQPLVRRGLAGSSQSARALGTQAVALGLETLDMTRIHEAALASLDPSRSKHGFTKRAVKFFTDAIIPIEKTHQAALTARVRLRGLDRKVNRRTAGLAASTRSLRQGIAKRKTVELALKKSAEDHAGALRESRRLLKHLRGLTHQLLAAQEAERRRLSIELRDELAQTLLGINVRLLTLKREGAVHTESLKKEIVSTQRVVKESVKALTRFAHEFGKSYES